MFQDVNNGLTELESQGFILLRSAIDCDVVQQLLAGLERALAGEGDETVALRNRGGVYGARNLLDVCPEVCALWRAPKLVMLLRDVLGKDAGLVRALFFDKPPERTWSLPWHQDLTIAVQDNRLASEVFKKPTTKAGVAHVEAPPEILRRMLTLRIHLDDVTGENGPLQVLPGSHHAVQQNITPGEPTTIFAERGDVLAMRPLLAHCSGPSTPGTTRHRRILHLEFAADRALADGYAWRNFME